jgi:hypothetical protein
MLQVIDRHIGIIYKRAVYRAMRVEYMKLYREARQAAEEAAQVVIRSLTPREKRVIITKAIGDCHAKLTSPESKTYWRAFIATGSWMPVYHMFEDATLRSNEVPVEETQVSLQHLPNYDYKKRCSEEKVAEAVKVTREEKDNAALAEQARLTKISEGLALEIASTQVVSEHILFVLSHLLLCITY